MRTRQPARRALARHMPITNSVSRETGRGSTASQLPGHAMTAARYANEMAITTPAEMRTDRRFIGMKIRLMNGCSA